MKTINQFMPYIYWLLIIGIIASLIALIVRLGKTLKKLALMQEVTQTLNKELDDVSSKTARIAQTKDSWAFFAALIAAAVILKETFKYYKSEKSLPKSFTKALIRHSSQVSKLRF